MVIVEAPMRKSNYKQIGPKDVWSGNVPRVIILDCLFMRITRVPYESGSDHSALLILSPNYNI